MVCARAAARAPRVLELQGRLHARRDGHADALVRDPDARRDVGHFARGRRLHRHDDAARIGARRLARGHPVGPDRPRAHAAADRAVVRGVHRTVRARAELLAAARGARADGLRLRRRMDGRRGADRRSDPRARPRQGGRARAVGLGDRLGPGGAAVCAAVLGAAGRAGMARAVPRRPRARAAGGRDPSLREGAGRLRKGEGRAARDRCAAPHRNLRAEAAVDHAARGAADHRRAGRLLRDHDVAADVPEDRAAPDRDGHGRLSRDDHRRLVDRLSDERLPDRPSRPQAELHPVRARLDGDRIRLHVAGAASDEHVDAVARLSARLLRVGHLLRDGRVPHRAVPDPRARLGAGLLLQRRPRSRRAVSVPDRRAVEALRARREHRHLRGRRVRRVDRRRADAARNARAANSTPRKRTAPAASPSHVHRSPPAARDARRAAALVLRFNDASTSTP